MPNDPREQMLVQAARAGDADAFSQLYQDNYQRVYALAYEALRERNTAAGVLRDTFAAAWTKLDAVPEGEPFSRWVLHLCSAQCDAVLRERGVPQRLDNASALELLTDTDPETFRLPQPYTVQPELMARLDGAVAALPDRQRRAVTLYYHNGLTLADTAAVLGTSPARVKSDLAHARREIVRRLRAEERAAGESYGWTTESETKPFRAALAAQLGGVMLAGGAAALLLKRVLASLKTGGSGAAAGGKAAASAGGKAAAAAGGKAAAAASGRIAAMSTTTKIIAGVTAAAVVAGGGYGIKKAVDNGSAGRSEPVEETQPLEESGAGAAAASVRVLDTVKVYRPDGMLWFSETYDYDDNCFVIRSTASEYEMDGSAVYEDRELVYEYDEDGRVLAVRSGRDPESGYRRYEYDEAGRLVLYFFAEGDGGELTYTYAYDEDGKRIRMSEDFYVTRGWSCVETQNDDGSRDIEMQQDEGPDDYYSPRSDSYDADGRLIHSSGPFGGYYSYSDEKNLTLVEITPDDGDRPSSSSAAASLVLMDSENRIYHEVYLCGADAQKTYDDDGYLIRIESSDGRYAEFTYRDLSNEPEPGPEPEDTAWKQAYLDFLQEYEDSEGWDLTEGYSFNLVYIDDDNIPEMVFWIGAVTTRTVVCTYHDGEVEWIQPEGWGIQVLEHEGLWNIMYFEVGVGSDVVWELRDGHFTQLADGKYVRDTQDDDKFTYYWNDAEVPEETYKAELARLFDVDRATYINNSGIDYDTLVAQLQS